MSQATTHWRRVHKRKNENLLFAEDLGPVGTKIDLEVIDSGVISVSGADNKSKPMPWLAFAGKDGKPKQKRLALNVTNCKAMQSITGTPVVERWRGWITLVVVSTTYTDQQTGRREKTDAIRVAPERPQAPRSSSGPAQDRTIVGSGATHDEAASQHEPRSEKPFSLTNPTEDEMREIAVREREEAERG